MPLETDLLECRLAMRRIQVFTHYALVLCYAKCAQRSCFWRIAISPTIFQYSPILAESLLFKHKLPILNRSRQRSPNLPASERFPAGLMALLVRPTRLLRSAIVGSVIYPLFSEESVIITNLD
jgi:hypothetical protein